MAGIFISYRREDAAAQAGRLYDRFTAHFGQDRVFMDIDGIKPGEDFVAVINQRVDNCDVLIAVIGKSWVNVKDEAGRTRLARPSDFVRLELAAAMSREKKIIPVLVDGAEMPRSSALPKVLRDLARRQAFEVSNQRFPSDVDRLIKSLEESVPPTRASKPRSQSSVPSFRIYKGHTCQVSCVAFSIDGSSIASGSAGISGGSEVRYWRAATGENVATIDYGKNPVSGVAISPNGNLVAIGSSSLIEQGSEAPPNRRRCGASIWTLRDGNIQPLFVKRTADGATRYAAKSVAFSPDGETLFAGLHVGTVTQWLVRDGSIVRTFGGASPVDVVAISRDGRKLASGSNDLRVRIYDRDHPKSTHKMEGHSATITGLYFTPDGILLASGSADQTVRLWRVADGLPVRLLHCVSPVRGVAISSDGATLAAGLEDYSVCLWRVSDWHLANTLEEHSGPVNSVVFSPDGKTLASSSDDGTVRLWAVA
jgi:hypothetical protein